MAYSAAVCCDKTLPISSRINRLGSSICVRFYRVWVQSLVHKALRSPTVRGLLAVLLALLLIALAEWLPGKRCMQIGITPIGRYEGLPARKALIRP
jgi:hypothetical protein